MNAWHPEIAPDSATVTGKFKIGQRVQYHGHAGMIYDIKNGWYHVRFDGKNPHCCPHYGER